jgi:hypothetical protein
MGKKMTKFKVVYSKEFSKIVYARNKKEAEWKFNRENDDDNKTFEYVKERKNEKN